MRFICVPENNGDNTEVCQKDRNLDYIRKNES